MKAYLVHEYGEAAKFTAAEIETPTIKPGHVLIEVKATSINPVDHKILTTPDMGINPELPAILHMDVAGRVIETGAGVHNFKVGDEVYGCAGGLQGPTGKIDGALAEYMLADANLIAHKPASLSFAEAAALPLVSITAWEGLFDRAKIQKGDQVLIHGGAGGVGHIALQLAKSCGAEVSVTVSNEAKAEIAKDMGADHVINYKTEAVQEYVQRLTGGTGFDVVYDTVGADNLDKSFEAVRTSGQVISIIGQNMHDLTPMHLKGLSLHLVFMLLPMLTGTGRAHHRDILREVAGLVEAGKVRPLLNAQRFGFDQINEAHDLFVSGQYMGKIVLEAR